MKATAPPLLTSAGLVQAGRSLPPAFDVVLSADGREHLLHCDALLRVLPGRRLVARARLGDAVVLAKLFIGPQYEVDRQREERGHAAFVAAGAPTPALIASGTLSDGGAAVLYEFLDAATPIEDADLGSTMPVLAQLHGHGVIQNDPHRGNFLRASGRIYVIDGGAVSVVRDGRALSKRASVDNLAQFLAQFGVGCEPDFDAAWRCYAAERGFTRADFSMASVRQARRRRVRVYLQKVLRDCSEFVSQRRFDRYLVCDRAAWAALHTFLDDIDGRFERGRVLKAGNTSTVVLVEHDRGRESGWDGRSLVIKRYNIKSWRHALSRLPRPSRAQRAWQNAHRLRLLGIATFAPLALVERRSGPLRRAAYLVMTEVAGDPLTHQLGSEQRAAMVQLFADLARAGVVHGDTKITNFVWGDGRIHLLDLDAMSEPRTRRGMRRAFARDVERLRSNWPDDAALRVQLDAVVRDL